MKKLIERVKLFFVMAFGGAKKIEDFLKLHVDDAVSFIEQIKKWIDDPTIAFIIRLSPAKYRDKIEEVRAKVEVVLDKVLIGLNIGAECIHKATFQERLSCAITAIRGKSVAEQQEIYRNIGVAYIQERSKEVTKTGEPIAESTARAMLELQYTAYKAEKAEAEKAEKAEAKKAAPKKAAKKK